MPVSLLDQLKRSAMLTAQIGMATRAQYSRHVPSNSTTVHILATGLQIDKYNHSMQGLSPPPIFTPIKIHMRSYYKP